MITIAKPKIIIDEEVMLLTKTLEEKCTIVHCTYINNDGIASLRIWPDTYIIEDNNDRRKLIKAFNISLMPDWTHHFNPQVYFTLVFEGLSSSCNAFHVIEDIRETGAFYTDEIQRNKTDVYNTVIMSKGE